MTRMLKNPLLTGGGVLLISGVLVNLGNYGFNLIVGRWLGPAAFADLSLIITLMLSLTLITATIQTIGAKFAAAWSVADPHASAALRAWLGRRAWLLGGGLALTLIGGASALQGFFQSSAALPFALLGVGIPLYLAQGVDRGLLQGQQRFGRLAATYQAEMGTRLLCGIGGVALGGGVNGAVLGLALSFAASWALARWGYLRPSHPAALTPTQLRAIRQFAGPAATALLGGVIISNSDIFIVKHFFAAVPAGHYAALALIGRVVFFAGATVVTVLFPLVAQRHASGVAHQNLLILALAGVGGISGAIVVLTVLLPTTIVQVLFGPAYLAIVPLLWLYALATMLYALANVIVNYRLATGDAAGSNWMLLAGGAQVVALWYWHADLLQVVQVQVLLMGMLLLVLLGGLLYPVRRLRHWLRPLAGEAAL